MEMGMELGYSEKVDDHLLFNCAITLIEVIFLVHIPLLLLNVYKSFRETSCWVA